MIRGNVVRGRRALHNSLLNGRLFISSASARIITRLFRSLYTRCTAYGSTLLTLTTHVRNTCTFVVLSGRSPSRLVLTHRHSPLYVNVNRNRVCTTSSPVTFTNGAGGMIFLPSTAYTVVGGSSVRLFSFGKGFLPLRIGAMSFT